MKMIREAIMDRLKEKKISARKCALDNGIIYQNFHGFLMDRRPMPIADIEKVLAYLGLKIS